jgi:hypothetical protein
MFPDVARWQRTLADRLTIALVATGKADEVRELGERFGLSNLLYQPEPEVFNAYHAKGTPSVVTITADGKIAHRIRSSHGAVEAAIRRVLQDPPPAVAAGAVGGEPDHAPRLEVSRWSGRGAQTA